MYCAMPSGLRGQCKLPSCISLCVTLRLHGRMLAQHAREAQHARVNGPTVAAEWRQRLRLAKLGELRSAAALLRTSHEHQMQRHAEIVQVSRPGVGLCHYAGRLCRIACTVAALASPRSGCDTVIYTPISVHIHPAAQWQELCPVRVNLLWLARRMTGV